jgi:hypothetical protein
MYHRVGRQLQAEIDVAVALGPASTTSGIVSVETLKSLSYLQAFVRKDLRIHPPMTDIVLKNVPSEGDTVIVNGKEHFLPSNTNIV